MARLVFCALLFLPLVARADMEPGNWELTVTAAVAGMGSMPPSTRTQCLSPADARDPSRVFGANDNPGCSFTNQRDTGSEFTFTVSCTKPLKVSGFRQFVCIEPTTPQFRRCGACADQPAPVDR